MTSSRQIIIMLTWKDWARGGHAGWRKIIRRVYVLRRMIYYVIEAVFIQLLFYPLPCQQLPRPHLVHLLL